MSPAICDVMCDGLRPIVPLMLFKSEVIYKAPGSLTAHLDQKETSDIVCESCCEAPQCPHEHLKKHSTLCHCLMLVLKTDSIPERQYSLCKPGYTVCH